MLASVQNNTKQQTFGNYTTTLLSKRSSWLTKDIKLNSSVLKEKSEGHLSIFKSTKLGVYCYTYPLNKYKLINFICKKFPSLKLLQPTNKIGYEASIHNSPAVSALTESMKKINKNSI